MQISGDYNLSLNENSNQDDTLSLSKPLSMRPEGDLTLNNKGLNKKVGCFTKIYLWWVDYKKTMEARVRLGKKINYIE